MNLLRIFLIYSILYFNINAAFCNEQNSKQHIIEKLKSSIKNLKSVSIDFEQTDSAGERAIGTLIVEKPDKFRCNYYEPFPLLIVGNKNYTSIYDYAMNSLNRISNEDNIFRSLFLEADKFDKNLKINYAKDLGNFYLIEIYYYDVDKLIKIVLDKIKNQISKITIIDGENEIEIKFLPIRNIKNINKKLFIIKEPEIYGSPIRLNKKELYKNYNFVD